MSSVYEACVLEIKFSYVRIQVRERYNARYTIKMVKFGGGEFVKFSGNLNSENYITLLQLLPDYEDGKNFST